MSVSKEPYSTSWYVIKTPKTEDTYLHGTVNISAYATDQNKREMFAIRVTDSQNTSTKWVAVSYTDLVQALRGVVGLPYDGE